MQKKIKIGISSCLLGNPTRYDGGHKFDSFLSDKLGRYVEWVPLCPEVEAGFSVPREPMQLVREAERLRLVTIENRRDMTDKLRCWTEGKITHLEQLQISGFILKARSPSCGVHNTPWYSMTGEIVGIGAGLFTEAVKRRFSSMPVEDEERLRDASVRESFFEQAFAAQARKHKS